MSDNAECRIHGETRWTHVCTHLFGEDSGLGVHRNGPTGDDPFPDAWCDDCEIIREAHGGWNEQTQEIVKLHQICSGCYERACIRNKHPSVTLDDLANLQWKCHSCEEWHTGPCLDFGYDKPDYWLDQHEKASRRTALLPWRTSQEKTFLDEDHCAIEDQDFFVRGIIHLPIIGTAESFRWGVWGSLSRENFQKLRAMHEDEGRIELPPMFSWLSNRIPEYPDTLNIKMYAHIQEPGVRPNF